MYKLFSQRKREELGQTIDYYIYDEFCTSFRNQFLHIVLDLFSYEPGYYYGRKVDFFKVSCEGFARESGLKYLANEWGGKPNTMEAFEYYVDSSDDCEFLDFMDYVLTEIIAKPVADYVGKEHFNKEIEELNYRLRQHSLGYEFANGELIVKTNEQIHREVIKPAIHLLHDKKFVGAEQEYFKAFNCYKDKNFKDAILNAIKAFESVLKVICKEMKYEYDNDKDTVKRLLQHLTDNKFYPPYLESHMNGIITTLESGAPTLRNKKAGHGQGQEIVEISQEYAEYALNLVATNIVFLVKIFNQQKGKTKK